MTPKPVIRSLIVVTVVMATLPRAVSAQAVPAPVIEWKPYEYKHAGGIEPAEWGTLSVPESYDAPSGRPLQLALVRFKATGGHAGPPTLYLAGGPGSSGIEAGRGPRFPLFMSLRQHGDVVLFDQRGAGHSRPNLGCRERWAGEPGEARSWPSMVALARVRVQSCVQRLRDEGVNVAAFNTRDSAHDIERIRQALGAPTVNLLAISYGTHLGLSFIKQYESRVNRAVLAGVVGPNHVLKLPTNIDRAVERLDREVRSDPPYASFRLVDTIRRLVRELDERPARVAVDLNGTPAEVLFSAFDLRLLLSLALEDRDTMKAIPQLVGALAGGQFAPAAKQMLGLNATSIPTAMNLAMECASGGTADRLGQIMAEEPRAVVGRAVDIPQPDICPTLGTTDLGDGFRSPVRAATPTLLVSGDLDARTPPSNAEEVRQAGLSRAAHIVIERGGHDDDLLVSSPDLTAAIIGFLGGQDATDRRITLPPIRFDRAGSQPLAPWGLDFEFGSLVLEVEASSAAAAAGLKPGAFLAAGASIAAGARVVPGVTVRSVAPMSFGARARIQPGDFILEHDDRPLTTPAAAERLRSLPTGRSQLIFIRPSAGLRRISTSVW